MLNSNKVIYYIYASSMGETDSCILISNINRIISLISLLLPLFLLLKGFRYRILFI